MKKKCKKWRKKGGEIDAKVEKYLMESLKSSFPTFPVTKPWFQFGQYQIMSKNASHAFRLWWFMNMILKIKLFFKLRPWEGNQHTFISKSQLIHCKKIPIILTYHCFDLSRINKKTPHIRSGQRFDIQIRQLWA